jgi:hypothetical protein
MSAAHIKAMTTALTAVRPAFTFAAAGQDFSLIRNANDNYSILDSGLNHFSTFSYGGDPEDSFELEAAAIASVEYKITHNL